MKYFYWFFVLVLSTCVFAQHNVRGTVFDSDGKALAGVNVVEKGTYLGTSTAPDGTFNFRASSGSITLVFSFIGYKTEEVVLNGESNIDVTFKQTALLLGEVQVVGSRSYARSATDSPVAIDV